VLAYPDNIAATTTFDVARGGVVIRVTTNVAKVTISARLRCGASTSNVAARNQLALQLDAPSGACTLSLTLPPRMQRLGITTRYQADVTYHATSSEPT
jgi:hypothetical protein